MPFMLTHLFPPSAACLCCRPLRYQEVDAEDAEDVFDEVEADEEVQELDDTGMQDEDDMAVDDEDAVVELSDEEDDF